MISTNKGINSKPTENRLMAGREFQRLLRRWRFIPAWAGNTPRSFLKTCPADGSSPRGRGTLDRLERQCAVVRFIPAWAGNTRFSPISRRLFAVHPRVGGEHRYTGYKMATPSGSSPRGRGTLPGPAGGLTLYRFIPAWAGNTSMTFQVCPPPAVHPRVGGEH